MPGPEELDESTIRDSLQRHINMSEYESQVYLALVQNGKQSMKDLAEASGVPKQRVYDTVETLRKDGFAELDDSYPKQAYAVDPTKTLGDIQSEIRQIENELDELHQAVSDIESGVAQFKNASTIEKYLTKSFESAENTVFLMASLDRIRRFENSLSKLDDVQVRLVISNVDEETLKSGGRVLEHSLHELADYVRGTPRSEPFVLSVDRQSGFFWPNGSSRTGSPEGFYVTDSELGFLFDRFLSDSIWPLATPHSPEDADRVPSLPVRYFRLRDCLDDIRLLTETRPIESLAVSFEGYETVSGQQASHEGVLAGFYYSEFDDRVYLEVELDGRNETGSEVVTVGGWKSKEEDFKAHELELRNRSAWLTDGIEEETETLLEECVAELPDELSSTSAVVGFDGYIDHIRRLVEERKSPRMYDEISEFDSLREMVTRATVAEKTLQFEWVESDRLPGGHTAHAGQSFSTLEYDLQLVGYFGQPTRDEFSETFPDADLVSLGQPTVTEYLHFEDGKVLFTESSSHQALNWETLCEYVPLDEMAAYLEETDFLTIGGWALIPEISTVWEGLREEVYPMLSHPPDDVLVCASDVDRLTETTLRSDIESLSALDDRIPVTLVGTREHANHLSRVFGSKESGRRGTGRMTADLRRALDVSRVAVTTSNEAALADGDGPLRVQSPIISDSAEEGTFEDHFTAGLAIGCAEDLSP